MGAKPSIQFTADADSIAEPGQKVVVSQTLEVDPSVLLDEVVEVLRYPVDTMKEYVLTSCEVEEHGPDEFTVKVILDGKKLDRYGYGRGDGTDRLDHWQHVVVDRKARSLKSTSIVPPQGCWVDEVEEEKKKGGGYGVNSFLADPVCVESYVITHEGERLSGDGVIAMVAGPITGAMTAVQNRKVKILSEQDSLKGDGQKSVISEPMDEHTDYDAFWDKFVEIMRSPPDSPITPEIIEVSEGEFHTVVMVPGQEEGQQKKVVTQIKHCKDSGEVSTVTLSDGEKISSSRVILHQKPLRLESWSEDADGKRMAGRGTAKALGEYVEAVIAPKSSGWFW